MCQNNALLYRLGQPTQQTKNTKPRPQFLNSKDLLGSEKQIFIEHDGCYYCLSVTKYNKLILTK